MSRLLTEGGTVMKRVLLAAVIRGMPMKATLENTCNRVAEVQDEITRKATLKAVGEWLECKIAEEAPDDIGVCFITKKDMEALKRGEMPKEGK